MVKNRRATLSKSALVKVPNIQILGGGGEGGAGGKEVGGRDKCPIGVDSRRIQEDPVHRDESIIILENCLGAEQDLGPQKWSMGV